MKTNDPRYRAVGVLIEQEHIKCLPDIFIHIPKTTVYKDLGINFNRFERAIGNPAIFRMQELMDLANLFGVDQKKFIDMAYSQILTVKNKRKD